METVSTESLYLLYLKHPVVVIDSREVVPGSLFFAIKGERFDGNQFAEQALDNGAAFAIVDDAEVVKGDRYILVEDVLTCLQDLARYHRRQFTVPVIGITGSNGKTTTKELVAVVLGSHYNLHYTQGNYNNHIGVPLTLLAMSLDTDVAVIEMGANHQGEIDMLCRIAEPSHGLITNIGKAHLEGFGGLEGVKKGKSELYRFLAERQGMAFINRDEPFLEGLAESVTKKVFYKRSTSPSAQVADLEIKLLADYPFLKVAFLDRPTQQLIEVPTQLHGMYNLGNLMTAIALGKYFKVPGEKIKKAIEAYIPSDNRSQLMEYHGNKFLLDAYNANPTSMKGAILAFGNVEAPRKAAILGDMLELGTDSRKEHEAIAKLALEQHYELLVFVGNEFKAAAEAHGVRHFESAEALKEWFGQQKFEGLYFLVKGSRGIGLERIIL